MRAATGDDDRKQARPPRCDATPLFWSGGYAEPVHMTVVGRGSVISKRNPKGVLLGRGVCPSGMGYSSGDAARRDRANSMMNAASTMSDRMPNGSSQTSGAMPGRPTVRLIT